MQKMSLKEKYMEMMFGGSKDQGSWGDDDFN